LCKKTCYESSSQFASINHIPGCPSTTSPPSSDNCDDVVCAPNMPWCGEGVMPEEHENPENKCCPLLKCPEKGCKEDAKLCDDGKTVLVRDPNNNCEFPECPKPIDTCTNSDDSMCATNIAQMGVENWCTSSDLVLLCKKTCYESSSQFASINHIPGCPSTTSPPGSDVICPEPICPTGCQHGTLKYKDSMGCEMCECDMLMCPTDVKKCPDGTYVSRDVNANCAWEKCPEEMMENCDGKTKGNFKCMCEEGMKSLMEYATEKDGTTKAFRRHLAVLYAIRDETMHCPEGSCLVEQETEQNMVGGMSDLYQCFNPITMELTRGKTEYDETLESSPMCSSLVYGCSDDNMDYCNAIPGDVTCMCKEGMEKVQAYDRRRTAIEGESLMCPEDNCVSAKEENDKMIVGGKDLFFECLNMKTGETTEGMSYIEGQTDKDGMMMKGYEYVANCANLQFICVPLLKGEDAPVSNTVNIPVAKLKTNCTYPGYGSPGQDDTGLYVCNDQMNKVIGGVINPMWYMAIEPMRCYVMKRSADALLYSAENPEGVCDCRFPLALSTAGTCLELTCVVSPVGSACKTCAWLLSRNNECASCNDGFLLVNGDCLKVVDREGEAESCEVEFTGCDDYMGDSEAMIKCLRKEIGVLSTQTKDVQDTCEANNSAAQDVCEDSLSLLKEVMMRGRGSADGERGSMYDYDGERGSNSYGSDDSERGSMNDFGSQPEMDRGSGSIAGMGSRQT